MGFFFGGWVRGLIGVALGAGCRWVWFVVVVAIGGLILGWGSRWWQVGR